MVILRMDPRICGHSGTLTGQRHVTEGRHWAGRAWIVAIRPRSGRSITVPKRVVPVLWAYWCLRNGLPVAAAASPVTTTAKQQHKQNDDQDHFLGPSP